MEFLSVIVDLVFVALLAINILDGRKKGFVKIILSFGAMILSWLIAAELSLPVSEWLNANLVQDWLTGVIENAVADSIGSGADAIAGTLPAYLINGAEAAGVSIQEVVSQISSQADAAAIAEQIYGAIGSTFVVSAIRIVSFFVIYAVLNWVFGFAIGIVNKVCKLPVLKSFNRLLGAAVGALKGVVVVGIIAIIIMLVAMLMPEAPFVQAVQQSVIYKIMTEIVGTIF